MDKKYQVFVSSTYEDLKEERQEVMHALLELECIPSGMELFPAADEDQWSLIKEVIDECDYYLLILGGRYGSTGGDGMGYTEKEYRYALETGKPIISFLHKDPNSLLKKNTEETEEGQKKFIEFREFVQNKVCKYWETPSDLGSVVSRSLIKLQKQHPGIGWVRGDLVPDKEASMEILALRKHIETLEANLDQARIQAPPGTEKLAQGGDVFTLNYSFKSLSPEGKYYNWDHELEVTWDDIFYYISPLMIDEASDIELYYSINEMVKTSAWPELGKEKDLKNHRGDDFEIHDEDFKTIKVQLKALGLINKSNKGKSVKDTTTYWTLTPYGDSVMNRLRAIEKV